METWKYIALVFIGFSIAEFIVILLFKNKISNNEINIKKPKIKNSTESEMEFVSDINKKGLFKRLKKKKNEK
jgi:hypothetical protein